MDWQSLAILQSCHIVRQFLTVTCWDEFFFKWLKYYQPYKDDIDDDYDDDDDDDGGGDGNNNNNNNNNNNK